MTSSNQVTGSFKYKNLMKQNFGVDEYVGSMKGQFRDTLLRFRAAVS